MLTLLWYSHVCIVSFPWTFLDQECFFAETTFLLTKNITMSIPSYNLIEFSQRCAVFSKHPMFSNEFSKTTNESRLKTFPKINVVPKEEWSCWCTIHQLVGHLYSRITSFIFCVRSLVIVPFFSKVWLRGHEDLWRVDGCLGLRNLLLLVYICIMLGGRKAHKKTSALPAKFNGLLGENWLGPWDTPRS